MQLKWFAAVVSLVVLVGCSSGPADEVVKETGPKTPEAQLGQAGGKDGQGQKGNFQPLPVDPP